jgi:hypothetical protein
LNVKQFLFSWEEVLKILEKQILIFMQ